MKPDHFKQITECCANCSHFLTKRPEYILESLDNSSDFHCVEHDFFSDSVPMAVCNDYTEE